MSSDYRIQLANQYSYLYEHFPLPVITCMESCAFYQGNELAHQHIPELCSDVSIRLLLNQIDMEWLRSQLMTNGSVHLSAVFAGTELDLHILPIFDQQTIEGILLFILNDWEISVKEEAALSSQITTLLNSGVRESIGDIFNCMDMLMLKSDILGTNITKTMLDPITANCYRILRMINNFSLYIRLTSQNVQLNYSTYDIAEYIADIAELVQPMSASMHIPIEFSVPDVPCILHADHNLLQLALIHLLHNSLYYTRDGNCITVSLKKSFPHFILTVQDKGLGIEPQYLEQVWQPYTSFDSFHRSMGLGLTLARHIVELHGGNITLESTLNEGTTVTVSLPVSPLNNVVSFAQQPERPPLNNLFSELCIGLSDAAISPFHTAPDEQ